MHLTGGQFKGRRIKVPSGVKPTLSKTRESVFNMLAQFQFENKTFLDMFAGSGLIGLEAISRGYDVLELEINQKNVEIIKENYNLINIKPKIIKIDSTKLKTDDKFEIIYADPPWEYDYSKIINKAAYLLDENGIVILESDCNKNFSVEKILKDNNLNLNLLKQKKYGRTLITFLK